MSGYPDAAAAEPAAAADGKAKKEKKKAAAAVPAGPPPAEKTADELAKLSKEERTAYHLARRAVPKAAAAAGSAAAAPAQLTKAQRRAIQEGQRKVKEDKACTGKEGDELFNELKLQGLSEDQAREVQRAMNAGETIAEDDEDDDEEPDDLLSSVRSWMKEQPEVIPEDAYRDFNMKVRFQGHVDTTPPDHLGCMLNVLLEQAFSGFDLTAANIKPGAVAKAFTPLAERWLILLQGLYSKITDVLDGVGVIVHQIVESVAASGAAQANQDTAVVGCLMAIRELDDLVEDEDLLVGCKGIESRSHVLQKFIEFLEEALEEDDDEEADEDEK